MTVEAGSVTKRAADRERGQRCSLLREDPNMLEAVAALAFILILGLLFAAFAVDD